MRRLKLLPVVMILIAGSYGSNAQAEGGWTSGAVGASAPPPHRVPQPAIVDVEEQVASAGAQAFMTKRHYHWLSVENIDNHTVTGSFGTYDDSIPMTIGFRFQSYGVGDYEIWLYNAGQSFYWRSVDPNGIYNGESVNSAALSYLDDVQYQNLLNAAGEIWLDPQLMNSPAVLFYGIGGYVPPPNDPIGRWITRQACNLATAAVGGAVKAGAEARMSTKVPGMSPSARGGFGASVALIAAAIVKSACDAFVN